MDPKMADEKIDILSAELMKRVKIGDVVGVKEILLGSDEREKN